MKKLHESKIISIIVIFATVLSSGYALSTTNNYYLYIEAILAYFFILKIIINKNIKRANILVFSFIMLLFMVVATYITTGLNNYSAYLSYAFKIIVSFGIVNTYQFTDFGRTFRKILIIICSISLIGYSFVNHFNLSIVHNLPLVVNVNEVPFKVGYLFFYIPWIPDRNLGVFWEPGLFATFIIFGLIYEFFFYNKRPSVFAIILYIVTLITTKSSAGYIMLFIIFSLLMIRLVLSSKNYRIRGYFTPLIFILMLIFLFNYSYVIELLGLSENPIMMKVLGEELQNQTRTKAISHNLEMFIRNPIFGLGVKETLDNIQYRADTSTSTYLLSVFGILGLQYTFYWIYGVLKLKSINIYIRILLVITFMLILNKEPHFNILFSWCIMFYLLKNITIMKENSMKKPQKNIRFVVSEWEEQH